ncbi:ketoacyl-ACP synthase III family protein [Streptomyces reniochalinae]|uniref:3-oxoacyl-ACP synthase n=1 Tax=Streptomyces reniochalinae TaxID=2250578 RepID=A0A367EEG4_9ACTN|nr:ketoacyl-ACP synthase III family protein [Streptomyces reniochalinae]RCG15737.1 3-oxoacyl-ACP synthase [Streptomyces reniochalinae]
MQTHDMFITGVGSYLPQTVTVEQAVEQGLYPPDAVEEHQLGGAAVAGDVSAPEMALMAAEEAVKRSGGSPEEIDLLLYADTWHQGPDGWQPQYYVQRHLLGDKALGLEIRQGCNGMFSAIELAAGHLRAVPERRRALLVASDNYGTPLMDRWRSGPGFIIGDAASALVLDKEHGFAQLLSVTSGIVSESEEVHRYGEELFPPGCTSGREVDFAARSAAFNRRALTEAGGTRVWPKVHQLIGDIVRQSLDEAGIGLDDVTRVAMMNHSREITEQRFLAVLGLPLSRSTWEFGRMVGHIGASDQIVSLDHLVSTGELAPGDHMLLFSVGPGITVSSAVVKVLHDAPWRA